MEEAGVVNEYISLLPDERQGEFRDLITNLIKALVANGIEKELARLKIPRDHSSSRDGERKNKKRRKRSNLSSSSSDLDQNPPGPLDRADKDNVKTEINADMMEDVESDSDESNTEDGPPPTSPASSTTEKKTPPIVLKSDTNWATLQKQLKTNGIKITGAKDVSDKKQTSVKIQPASTEDFRKITKFFDEKRLGYHTYQLPEEKDFKSGTTWSTHIDNRR